jgi:hypothetical protein
MRIGRFHPSKYRSKVKKIGEETLKGLFSKLLIHAAHFLFFGCFGQLLLVGSITYQSCPDFS